MSQWNQRRDYRSHTLGPKDKSDIRIKDSYGATNGIAEVMWDELGWQESGILAINRGTGDSKFLGSLMDRDIGQHNHFMGKKDPKVGPHKNNQFIAVEHFELSSIHLPGRLLA